MVRKFSIVQSTVVDH